MPPLITHEEAIALGEIEDHAEIEALVELRESCFLSEDFREGISAFADRRPPRWKGR